MKECRIVMVRRGFILIFDLVCYDLEKCCGWMLLFGFIG